MARSQAGREITIMLPFMLQIHFIVSILLYKPFRERFIILANEPFTRKRF